MGKIKHQLNRKHNQKIFPTHPLLRQVSCTEVSIYMYIHCCSLTQSRPTLCDPMNFSTPGLTVPHYLPKFAQVHVHGVSDAIQSSHPLSSLLPCHCRLWALSFSVTAISKCKVEQKADIFNSRK